MMKSGFTIHGWSARWSTARSRSKRSNAAVLLILMSFSATRDAAAGAPAGTLSRRARCTEHASLSCSAGPSSSKSLAAIFMSISPPNAGARELR